MARLSDNFVCRCPRCEGTEDGLGPAWGFIDELDRRFRDQSAPPPTMPDPCRCCGRDTLADTSCTCGWNPSVALREHLPRCPDALPF